jgi:Predicted membrane protein (DUF2142)
LVPRLVILGGLLALIAGVAVAGAQSGHRQLSSNLIPNGTFAFVVEGGDRVCQRAETIPAGTSAVRMTLGTYGPPGPPLEMSIRADGRTVTRSRLEGGWRQGSVVIPLPRELPRLMNPNVCWRSEGDDRIAVAGAPVDPRVGARVDGEPIGAAARFEFTTSDERSWWSLLGTIPDRMGAVRVAFPGSATMWIWLGLLAVVVAGVAAVLLWRPRRVVLAVAGLALVNALAWGLVTPPWQVPDEQAHYYYASYLAETGEVPVPRNVEWFSERMRIVLTFERFPQVIGNPDNRQPWTPSDRAAVVASEDAPGVDELGDGHAGTASTNSPAYYLLQAGAYKLSPSSDLNDRLVWMRLVSAVISALTAALTYAFLRELLPGSPFAALVGALAALLQPMFGFISSGVNNDGLLYLCSALVLFAVARAFRRGLTPRRAAAIGGALAVGALVKTQLIAYAPAVLLAFALLLMRVRGPWRMRSAAAGAVALAVPLLGYFVLGQTVWDRPVIDRVGEVAESGSPTVTGMVSYVWQSYLPRLPFLQDWFPGLPLKNLWIDGLVGNKFGWLDYSFPSWVLTLGTLALALVAAGAVATLYRYRVAVGRRAGEALVYVTAAVGLAVAVAYAGYVNRVGGERFEQARYLLPLLPLYAAAVALAIQALGRRRLHVLGAIVVLAALAHTVFAQLLTMTRYYG